MTGGKYKDGDYIRMIWDGTPEAYYIKGHVSHVDGIDNLINEDAIDDESEVGLAEHKYGRWSTQGDCPDGCTQTLREYKEAGRGRFKITVFGVGIFAKGKE